MRIDLDHAGRARGTIGIVRGDIREDGRSALRSAGRTASFRRGDWLIVAGQASSDVLLLEAGLVKAVLPDQDGVETVVGLFGPGELLGEIGVLTGRPRSAHIVALIPGSAVHVPGSAFRQMQRLPDVGSLLTESWWKRQQCADVRHLALARDVRTRVATTLLNWAREFGRETGSGLVLSGVSQRDLAQAVCASDKTVDAVLAELRAAGLIDTGRLRYRVLAPQLLAKLTVGSEIRTDR